MAWRVAFALLVSGSAVLVLIAWVAGGSGNPVVTAALLAGAPAVMIWSGRGAEFRVNEIDVLFVVFVVAAVVSTVVNGLPPMREVVLFCLSLLAYPAGRLAPLGRSFRPFMVVTLVIVAVGTVVVGISLLGQWNDPHGKPIVLGFNHAGTVFLTSLGFLLFAVICFGGIRRPLLTGLVAAPALVVFAASQVRFTFVAIGAALLVAFYVGGVRRQGVAVILVVLAASIVVGLSIRSETMFVLCCLAYVVMIDMAHGHLASEGVLFLFTGYAARIKT